MEDHVFADGDTLTASKLNEIESYLRMVYGGNYDYLSSDEYTSTIWQAGDIVTADKLNNMANGIATIFEVFPPPEGYTYTPVTWITGEVVSAEKLNAMLDLFMFMLQQPDPEES